MELFKGQSLLEFTERFKTDLDCEEYLASIKWEKGYCCRKCGHKKYQDRRKRGRKTVLELIAHKIKILSLTN